MNGLDKLTPEQICEQTGWKPNRQAWLSGFHYGEDREKQRSKKLLETLKKATGWFKNYGEVATLEVAIEEYEAST